VARAKRTQRADARRRYRQAVAAEESSGDAAATTAIPTAARADRPRSPAAPTAPAERPSVVAAFRSSASPANIRADIAAFPSIARGSKAVWVPTLLSVAAGAVFVAFAGQDNAIVFLAFNALVQPPPMATAFLAGILAPRASWLAGGVVSLLSAVVYAIVVAIYPSAGTSVTPELRAQAILFALVASPLLGVAVGAFAGFYRRFLRTTNPSSGRSNGRKGATARR